MKTKKIPATAFSKVKDWQAKRVMVAIIKHFLSKCETWARSDKCIEFQRERLDRPTGWDTEEENREECSKVENAEDSVKYWFYRNQDLVVQSFLSILNKISSQELQFYI